MIETRDQKILKFIKKAGVCSSKQAHNNVEISVIYVTLKRILSKLTNENFISTVVKGKRTTYNISLSFELFETIGVEKYYEKEIDEKVVKKEFIFFLN